MNNTPFFTIAIPTYNRAAFLKEALASASAQTFQDFEICVSDNASTDDTEAVMRAQNSPRIRYFRQPENLGAGGNFNFLVNQAKGRYFVVHQDDDLLHPEFLARCHAAVAARTDIVLYASLVACGPMPPSGIYGINYHFCDTPLRPLDFFHGEIGEFDGAEVAATLLFHLPFTHPGIALRTSDLQAAGGYCADLSFASDNLSLARVCLRGRVLFDTRAGAFFRTHEANLSRQLPRLRQFASRRIAYGRMAELLNKNNPAWPQQAVQSLKSLPRRKKRRLLAEAWEGDYPREMRDVLAQSLAAGSKYHARWQHWHALLFKANWRHFIASRVRNINPG